MEIQAIRRARLRQHVETLDAQNELQKFGVSASHVSQLLGGRSFGEKAARNLEEKIGLEPGWLDRPLGVSRTAGDSRQRGEIVIGRFDVSGRMGKGGMTLEGGHPDLIHSWNVSEQWARANLPYYTSASNLRIITGYGDSNRGIYNSGDPLIIDAGITSVDRDAFYFFRLDGHGFIKMLQRMPHEGRVRIRAKSNNPLYEPFWIDETLDFEILGVVLKVWRGENL